MACVCVRYEAGRKRAAGKQKPSAKCCRPHEDSQRTEKKGKVKIAKEVATF